MEFVCAKILVMLKMFMAIVFIVALATLVWIFRFSNDIKITNYPIFKEKIENYKIYYPNDFLEDLPYLYSYLNDFRESPLKFLTFFFIFPLVLLVRFFQFFICIFIFPFFFFGLLIKIYKQQEIKIIFDDDINPNYFDLILLIFLWLPFFVCWNRSYAILKWLNKWLKYKRLNGSNWFPVFYNFVIRKVLGVSFSTLYGITRIHHQIHKLDKNIWLKNKPFFIIPRIVLNNLYSELWKYDSGYIQRGNKKRIYFEDGEIYFNPMLPRGVLALHQKAGHFDGPCLRGIKSTTPKGEVKTHPSIKMAADGDLISEDVLVSSNPVRIGQVLQDGDTPTTKYVINQIQEVSSHVESHSSWVLDLEKTKLIKFMVNAERVFDSNMLLYQNEDLKIIGVDYYKYMQFKKVVEVGDVKAQEEIKNEIKSNNHIFESNSSLEQKQLERSILEKHPNYIKKLSYNELNYKNIGRTIETGSFQVSLLQESTHDEDSILKPHHEEEKNEIIK